MNKYNLHRFVVIYLTGLLLFSCSNNNDLENSGHLFNGTYTGKNLDRVAFPIGGIGAGMICLEGSGGISHVSVRNHPDLYNEPFMMAAISIKGLKNGAKILEGPLPDWKVYWNPQTGYKPYGFPRFDEASFKAEFPFGVIKLKDKDIPLDVSITGWSPFIPADEDNSSLPVAGFEYTFKNTSDKELEACFSYHAVNLMRFEIESEWGGQYFEGSSIAGIQNGFLLHQDALPGKPYFEGDFAIYTDDPETQVDLCWFRGGWNDSKTVLWKDISNFTFSADSVTKYSPGASLYIPFKLKPGEHKTVRLMMNWYVPYSNLREGLDQESDDEKADKVENCKLGNGHLAYQNDRYYEPWYSGRFKNIEELTDYWSLNYNKLKEKTSLFTNSFYNSTLPAEVIEAVAANLTILKSPTVLRQKDGKLWAWEGCFENKGSCYGSCTHVWNYAQALPHLFPKLERSLRESEFLISQNDSGHQNFRTSLPIQRVDKHDFYAAADGQLGGIMKIYREWRISGDTDWMKSLYPSVKRSIDYCIRTWDPKHKGVVEEPHHNTYDIEFWGPDGMCTSFYLGALTAIIEMGKLVGDDISEYTVLLKKGQSFLENELYNGEYFIQKITVDGLEAKDPVASAKAGINMDYSAEAKELLQKEGPKYQYGSGCLSDGILGAWIGKMCDLEDFINPEMVKSHLNSVYKYNFRTDLTEHVNPQRSIFGLGKEGGLLLCTWPKGDKPTLPFVYSDEVWTGIEYQVASHLMSIGEVDKGLNIVRQVRKRYNGKVRNPFNEIECGNWYARAMSSYGLFQGLTGVRYDAVEKCLYIDSKVGDFTSFISTETGFGTVTLQDGIPSCKVVSGTIDVLKYNVSGKEIRNNQ